MPNNRKKFIQQVGAGLLMTGLPAVASAEEYFDSTIDISDFENEGAADDEKYWKHIAHKYYIISRDYINLENGYYGIQPKPVLQAFQKNILLANRKEQGLQEKFFLRQTLKLKKSWRLFLGWHLKRSSLPVMQQKH